nr:retrovirus-related Pol polyprotein from transposon TNT 1-94 [Tanacetum cinerariifolium]
KFLRAIHPKWRAKVMAIEESKYLSSLALEELIENLKVHEVVMKKDYEIYNGKKERIKSIALKSKKESSDDETSTSESDESKYLSSLALEELIENLKVHEVVMKKDYEIYNGKKERIKSISLKSKKESSDDETSTSKSDDEEYAMAVRNFKKFFGRKGKIVWQPREERKSLRQRDEKKGKSDHRCFRCGDPSHLIGNCPKTSRNKDQKAFIGGSWSDSENDAEDKTNDETCHMAQSSNEVTLNSSSYSDNTSSLGNDNMQIEYDSLCEISLKFINKNKILKTKRDLLQKEILELNEKIKKPEKSKEIEMEYSKPTKTPMSSEIKLTKDDESDSVEALNIEEAEYVFIGKACQQALWMKQALIDYGIRLDNVPIMCDNKGDVDLSKNPVQHSRTKHIEIRHYFLRDNIQKGNISIEKVASEDNIADIFTMPLKCEVFNFLRLGLGMMELIMDTDPSSSQK